MRLSMREFVKMAAMVVTAANALADPARGASNHGPMAAGFAGATAAGSTDAFRYERMSSKQVSDAIKRCPVAFVSAGIVEWHGEQSACGLDGLKAESLGWMASELLGGVCCPHVWLGPDVSTPFDPTRYPRGTVTIDKTLYLTAAEELLTQIEAMGFRVAVYLSGHYPGVIPDVAKRFNQRGKMKVISVSENQVVKDMPAGDHAATWETSVLQVLRPGLVDLSRLPPLPRGTRPAGQVMPPAWKFSQRSEYYGVYGSDPRVWANTHFGRRGVEAVIDGLAREIREALGDASYARHRRGIVWPFDTRQTPEVRYDYQLPYQWIKRFEQAPIVYVPLPATGEPAEPATERAVRCAHKTGGMVFPPLSYGPRRNGAGVHLSAEVFGRVVDEIVQDLADMDFRVVALLPGADLDAGVRKGLADLKIPDGQARVVVLGPTDQADLPPRLADAIRAMIPSGATSRQLAAEWRVDGGRTIRDLREGVYGPADARAYECTFELSQTEAAGAVQLDLGTVENHCEVIVNNAPPLTDHWPPYRFILSGRVKPGPNTLRIAVHHKPQPTLDRWYYRVAPARLAGPVTLAFWNP